MRPRAAEGERVGARDAERLRRRRRAELLVEVRQDDLRLAAAFGSWSVDALFLPRRFAAMFARSLIARTTSRGERRGEPARERSRDDIICVEYTRSPNSA